MADESQKIQNLKFEDKALTLDQFIDTYLRTCNGTNGNDNIQVSPWTDKVYAGAGNDTISTNGSADTQDKTFYGEDGNDYIYGALGNDSIYGDKGNDILYSGKGNDILYGGDGSDYLSSETGDDILHGGTGDDTLYGGDGDDIYTFTQGDGIDYINDYSGEDTVRINGVEKNNIAMYLKNGQLVIKYGNTDQITVQDQDSVGKAIERFELDNNLYMTNTDVNNLIQDINSYAANNDIQITDVNTVKNNQDLMQLVAGAWHS